MHILRVLALIAIAPATAHAQWTFVPSGTSAELRGLSIVSDRVAWASGTRGTVLRSLDGGRTWRTDSIPGAATLDFRAIFAIDADTAFVASAGEAEKGLARLYATRDAGRSWNIVFSTDQKGVFFDDLKFWDARNGIALSDPVDSVFFLLATRDGGRSWSRLPPATLPRVLPGEAAFAASGSSIVVHAPGTIHIGTGGGGRARTMTSRDRGATWSVAETPVHAEGNAAGIFAIDFAQPHQGMAVGGDYTKPKLAAVSVAETSDSGRTWRAQPGAPAAYLSGVAFERGGARAAAVGLAGTFMFERGVWTQTDTVPMNAIRARFGLWIAVGPRGRVARMDGRAP